uniref:Uncharacterized protein LOC114336922 n=1 Tax=Diabrotica virgifera virgifera TaxID=50390 RepID=A0A6P7G845_DIAVI
MDKNTQNDVTSKHREEILKYLGKTEEDLAASVELMKSWFKTQPHLPEVPSTKKLEFYIVNNTFNLESAKTRIDQFYTLRSTLTVIFDTSNPKSPEQKAAIDSAYNGLGERLKEMHFINCPPFFQIIMNILRAVMRADFFTRLHIHHTVDTFRERFPSELLPKDYGGNEKCMDELEAAWIKKCEEYQEHFDRLDTLRVDESLRPNPDVPKDLIELGFDRFRRMFFDL